MPTVAQINVTANSGSTGTIAEQINQLARNNGWDTYLIYGRRMQPCESKMIHVGNNLQVCEHYLEHRLFDNDGLGSRCATHQLIHYLKSIQPDIIHLHNIHDHWLNYRILFENLRSFHVPIVWTQHDCWSITGGCSHFALRGCYRWRDGGCSNGCPSKRTIKPHSLCEKTIQHYSRKSRLFSSMDDMTIVTVSNWLEGIFRMSFLRDLPILTIHNGVDISLFRPLDSSNVRKKYKIGDGAYVLGVSSVWLSYKGWNDYLRLSCMLLDNVRIVMVGLNDKQLDEVGQYGIVGIPRTDNTTELAELYSGAKMTLNLSRQESFGLTTVEGFACGTPGVVYNSTASPELILDDIPVEDSPVYTGKVGWVVKEGDITSLAKVINTWINTIKSNNGVEQTMRSNCRIRAVKMFNKDEQYADYIALYDSLLK